MARNWLTLNEMIQPQVDAWRESQFQANTALRVDDKGDGIKYFSSPNSAVSAQAYDQYMRSNQYQTAFKDLAATGVNPTYALLGGASSAGGASSNAVNSAATEKELKIAKQNADAATMTAKASMINAFANSAKAVGQIGALGKPGKSFIFNVG